jgi:hypothetical protein
MKNFKRLFSFIKLANATYTAKALCAFCLLPIAYSSAIGQYSISGKITDAETGKPLVSANVTFENTSRGTATNQQGVYNLKNLKKGSYILKISYLGFEKITKSIDLQKDEKVIYSWKKITDALNIVQSIKYFSELLMNDN